MPEGAVRAYLAGPLEALTPATNTDPVSLLEAIEEARRRGWAINRGELHLEAGALAVPVRIYPVHASPRSVSTSRFHGLTMIASVFSLASSRLRRSD